MISLRLGEALEGELEAEARRSGRTRSQLVRQALLEYLAGAERQRRYAGAVAELQGAYGDPASRREALARAEETLDDGFDEETGPARTSPSPDNQGWWR